MFAQSGKPRWFPHGALVVVLLATFPCSHLLAATTQVSGSSSADAMLARARELASTDHARFVVLLKQLQHGKQTLTPAQRWRVKYLEAVQLQWVHAGKGTKAAALLRDIIDHSGDPSLAARATANLVQLEALSRHYKKAYVLTGSLLAKLPDIADKSSRRAALSHIVEMFNNAGQYPLALKYARRIIARFPSADGQCQGRLAELQTLMYSHQITSTSPRFHKTVALCLGARQVASANALRLDLASLMTDEGRMDQSIAYLHRIAPSIRKSGYKYHIVSLPITLAQNYVKQGRDALARKNALKALTLIGPDSTNWISEAANKVLYQVAQREGNAAAALGYYKKYVAQADADAADAKARAMAYQEVRQKVLAKKLQLDELSKKNQVLKLRQSLSDKTIETDRLYFALSLVVFAFIVLWLLRLKHSQLRFRRMARHDDLTGVFSRQHFLAEAERALERLHKASTAACFVILDLDHFKQVNDSYGHAAGDEVLRRTVATCREGLRTSDVFGRLGGEEFGIVMPDCAATQGFEIVSRVRAAIAAATVPLEAGGVASVSASFGLACSDQAGHDLHALLRAADAALYRAKNGGRNQVAVSA